MRRLNLDNIRIKELYVDKKLSLWQIANEFNCNKATISDRLKKQGVEVKGGGWVHPMELNPTWKGGKTHSQGYVLVMNKTHRRANTNGYVWEHILVWENTHKKELPKGWVIHHLNGIKDDNRPENLLAMKRGEHINLGNAYKERIRQLELYIKKLESMPTGEIIA